MSLEANTILSMALAISVKVSIVLLLAGVLALALHRRQASLRHLIWSLAIGSALLLPPLTLLLPDLSVPALSRILPSEAIYSDIDMEPAETVSQDPTMGPVALDQVGLMRGPHQVAEAAETSQNDGVVSAQASAEPSPSGGAAAAAEPPPPEPGLLSNPSSSPGGVGTPAWGLAVLAVWLSGASAVLLMLLAGVAGTQGIARRSRAVQDGRLLEAVAAAAGIVRLRRRVRVLVAEQSAMPMTWGVIRPTIVLPTDAEDWSDERLHVVLLHELAHIRRHDWLTQIVARLACALHWFNPLIWLAVYRLQHERELACDDYVLRAGSRPSDYASHLLEVARSLHSRPLAAQAGVAMARPSGFSQRMRAVLEAGRERNELRPHQVHTTWLGAAVLVLPLAAVSAAAPESFAAAKVDTPPADVPALQMGYGYTETPEGLEVQSALPDRGVGRVDVVSAVAATATNPDDGAEAACDWMRLRGQGNYSASTQIDDDRVKVRIRHDECELEIDIEGEFQVNEEETDVVRLDPRGHFELEERDGDGRFRLVIEADRSGQLERRWYVDGKERQFDQEARSWLAEMLPTMYRVTGIDAERRARRILQSRGTDGLLKEVALIRSDHAASRYYGVLLTQPDLDRDDYVRILRQASSEISSDHSLGRLLMMIAESDAIDDEAVRLAYVEASGSIGSDHEKGRVLSTILTRRDLNQEATGEMLRQARTIGSDHEVGELLRAYLDRYDLPEALVPEFFAVVDDIGSDHETGRVLEAVLEKGTPSQEVLDLTLRSARNIGSDHEMGKLLKRTAELYPVDRAIPESYMEAARSIGSDHELGGVLSELLRRATLEPAAQLAVLEVALSIGSDHELSRLLIDFQSEYELTDANRDAFFRAVGSIGSDHSHASVLKELLDQSNLSDEDLAAVLGSALRIGSDSTLSQVLVKAADSGRIEGELRDAYLRVAESISSESQRSRALAALAR